MLETQPSNLPTIESANLPPSSDPSPEDVAALEMYMETGCVPVEYLEATMGRPEDGVTLTPDPVPVVIKIQPSDIKQR